MEISEFAKLAIFLVCALAIYPICIITGENIKHYATKGEYKNDRVTNHDMGRATRRHPKG